MNKEQYEKFHTYRLLFCKKPFEDLLKHGSGFDLVQHMLRLWSQISKYDRDQWTRTEIEVMSFISSMFKMLAQIIDKKIEIVQFDTIRRPVELIKSYKIGDVETALYEGKNEQEIIAQLEIEKAACRIVGYKYDWSEFHEKTYS